MKISDVTLIIDWILRIVQITTFIGVILKISFNKNSYTDTIVIKKIRPDDFDSLNMQFRFIQIYENSKEKMNIDYFLLYPNNVDIKKLDFIDLKYDSEAKEIEEIRETKNNIKNATCIIIGTILPEGAPCFRVRWVTSKGEMGEYTFHYNGFNGNSDMLSYQYNLTFWKKIQYIFGLN